MTAIDEQVALQIDVFHARVEMMVLAFIDKHGRRPQIVMAETSLKSHGWMSAFVSPKFFAEDESVAPSLLELARHGGRAWRAWTKLEADGVVITLRVLSRDTVSVAIAPRTPELERAIALQIIRDVDRNSSKS